jgi:hypothetical protein
MGINKFAAQYFFPLILVTTVTIQLRFQVTVIAIKYLKVSPNQYLEEGKPTAPP